MRLKIKKRVEAKLDLDELAFFLEKKNPSTGFRFYKAAELTFAKLAKIPGLGSPWETNNPSLANLLFWPIQGFPKILVFFFTTDTEIDIVRVMHSARDLGKIFR